LSTGVGEIVKQIPFDTIFAPTWINKAALAASVAFMTPLSGLEQRSYDRLQKEPIVAGLTVLPAAGTGLAILITLETVFMLWVEKIILMAGFAMPSLITGLAGGAAWVAVLKQR
jgi:hypothetical protein